MKNKKFDFYLGIIMMLIAVFIYIIDSSNIGVPLVLFFSGLVFAFTAKDNEKDF